jgi:hypothetical protein
MSNETHNILALKCGQLTHISEVENGLNCKCFCAGCRSELVAHKGDIRAHHFQHKSHTSCTFGNGGTGGGLESIYHWGFKKAIEQTRKFKCPPIIVEQLSNLINLDVNYTSEPYFSLTDPVAETGVKCEENYRVPDVTTSIGSHKVAIEVTYTHKTSEKKKKDLKLEGYEVLEVKLQRDIAGEEKDIINFIRNREWQKLSNLLFRYSTIELPSSWQELGEVFKKANLVENLNQTIKRYQDISEINQKLAINIRESERDKSAFLSRIDELEVNLRVFKIQVLELDHSNFYLRNKLTRLQTLIPNSEEILKEQDNQELLREERRCE